MRDWAEQRAAWSRQRIAQVVRWCAEQRRAPDDGIIRALGAVLAMAVVAVLLSLARADTHSFDSLSEMYEPLASVGLGCAPPPPVLTDPVTGRDRAFCSASDGSLAVLELSDSHADAEQAVMDAHAGSQDIVRYAQLARQVPVAPRPVLLGGNWTVVGVQAVLEEVAAEYGGTIYPYPEVP